MSGPAPSTPLLRQPGSWLPFGLLVLLLGVTAGGHLHFINRTDHSQLKGDENHYQRSAYAAARLGERGLLPGTLNFEHWPPLTSRVYSNLIFEFEHEPWREIMSPWEYQFMIDRVFKNEHWERALMRRARHLNLLLFLLTIVLVYAQGPLLGLGRYESLIAPALLAAFPWYSVFVHTLFSEILYCFFQTLAFVLLMAHLRRRSLLYLFLGGAVYGYALLTRGSAKPFLPFVVLIVGFVELYRQEPIFRLRVRSVRAIVCAAVFLLGLGGVLGPQLYVNARAGHGWRIAGNTWRNIETGLTDPLLIQHPPARWKEMKVERRDRYYAGGDTLETREARAKERVMNLLSRIDVGSWLAGRIQLYGRTFFQNQRYFENFLEVKRWGPETRALEMLRQPSRVMWFVLLALGMGGVAAYGLRSAGHVFLTTFLLSFFAALVLTGHTSRFLIPAIPTLCVFSGQSVAGLFGLALDRTGRGDDEGCEGKGEREAAGRPA